MNKPVFYEFFDLQSIFSIIIVITSLFHWNLEYKNEKRKLNNVLSTNRYRNVKRKQWENTNCRLQMLQQPFYFNFIHMSKVVWLINIKLRTGMYVVRFNEWSHWWDFPTNVSKHRNGKFGLSVGPQFIPIFMTLF